MASASSARQIGDEAQQYLFWLSGARMLLRGEITEVGYETGHFKAFDDVAARFSNPRSDGFGGFFDEQHFQAKFSVTREKSITGEALAYPEFINATAVSLIERLRDAVNQAEAESRRCCFTLWSPWPAESGSLLAKMIDTSQGALRLEPLFAGKTAGSSGGRLRKCWADKLGINMNDQAEFRRILRPFRIENDTRTLKAITADCSDVFASAGLDPISESKRADSYALLIQRLHREGSSWFSPQALVDACRQDGLWIGRPQVLAPVTKIGIRTFMRFAGSLESETDEMLCLTQFFTDRHIREDGLWEKAVLPGLRAFLTQHLNSGARFRLHFAAVGSVAFSAGYLAEPKLGAEFEIMQRGTHGEEIWRCISDRTVDPVSWNAQSVDLHDTGEELAVAISVTHLCFNDVRTFVEHKLPLVSKLLHLSLPSTAQNALIDGGHAFQAAAEAVRLISETCQNNGTFRKVHLFWAAPNAFAFMLGQLARPLGSVALYEFDFEGTGVGRYQPSLELTPAIRLG